MEYLVCIDGDKTPSVFVIFLTGKSFSQMASFDTEEEFQSFVEEQGDVERTELIAKKFPDTRSDFAWHFDYPNLFIHGGRVDPAKPTGKVKFLSDLWHLSVQTLQWKKLFLMDGPKARQ